MPTNSIHVKETKFEEYCHMTFVGNVTFTFNRTKTQSIWCSSSAVLVALEIMTLYFQLKFCEEEKVVLRLLPRRNKQE